MIPFSPYSPEKNQIIINLLSRNLSLEIVLLLAFWFLFKKRPHHLSRLILVLITLELFIFAQGNVLTAPLQKLSLPSVDQHFGINRYLSTSDAKAYTGPSVYWNHLRVRQPLAPDLSNRELVTFSRLQQEIAMLPGNLNIIERQFNASGYSAVVLNNYAQFWDSELTNSVTINDLTNPKLKLLNVKYFITGFPEDYVEGMADWELIEAGPRAIYQSKTSIPRAFSVLDQTPASIIEYSSERVLIHTNFDQPTNLVLTDSYYPGWIATVDSQPTNITAYQQAFRQIEVPPDGHEVLFSYQPTSVKIGFTITALSLIILTLLYLWPSQNSLLSSLTGTESKTH